MKFYGPYIFNASLVFKRIHFRLDISDINIRRSINYNFTVTRKHNVEYI